MENEQKTQQVINNLVIRSTSQLREGMSKNDAISFLINEGCPTELANTIVDNAEKIIKAGNRQQAGTGLMIGIGLFGLGLVISLVSYNSAVESGGGHYTVAIGMMASGVILTFKSLWKSIEG